MSDVADDITEQYATAMEEAIESATKAEAGLGSNATPSPHWLMAIDKT